MRVTFILCVATVLIGLAGIAWGHYPEGVTFLAFQWPEGYEPVMDGDPSEWDIVSSEYILRREDFVPIQGRHFRPVDPAGFQILRGIIGWSRSQNRLYLMAEVLDDVQVFFPAGNSSEPGYRGLFTSPDGLYFYVDADHGGECYAQSCFDPGGGEVLRFDNADATSYIVGAMAPDRPAGWNWNRGYWNKGAPWIVVGWSLTPQDGVYRVVYEVSVIPFDWLDWQGLEESVVHPLTEGEIIGMHYGVQDVDPGLAFSGLAVTDARTKGDVLRDASFFADVRLMPVEEALFSRPTGVESGTWGRIKSTISRRRE